MNHNMIDHIDIHVAVVALIIAALSAMATLKLGNLSLSVAMTFTVHIGAVLLFVTPMILTRA